uniref:Ubiquitin-like modifier-activating enzyme ATG7 n=1 Tax=Talaromyces marneffei PM1 TaxID=1077442 RepID=A0A093W3S1_TALMA
MQYTPFVSDIELPFYTSLASQKINHDKLDDSAKRVQGLYEIRTSDAPAASCRMQILGNALNSDHVPPGYYRAEGTIKNFNTVEEYKNADKMQILQQAGRTIWDAIRDGSILSNPSILSSFLILSFADLKKYKFQYWFAFPAITSQPHWVPVSGTSSSDHATSPSIPGSKNLSEAESSTLVDTVQTWKANTDVRQHGFFLVRKEKKNTASAGLNTPEWKVSSLADYENGFFDGLEPQYQYFAFADPSNYPNAPGWMLRNLLVLLQRRWGLQKAQILFYRDIQSKRELGRSLAVTLQLGTSQDVEAAPKLASSEMPKITGWERNSTGKLAGRISDLTAYMDPRRLADQAVDLNLKLIKWRISPGLDLDKVKATSCLLLGAGTLGSYVARNLMKATRAAAALKGIYPGVVSEGHVFSVLMPGHPVTDVAQAAKEFELLRKLIEEHDAIFLLMDSRESRWLPTVMGKSLGKIVMNAALGFDTFVAMRHGVKLQSASEAELGCYFCNDVVAPMDSMKDQTLDQQCTVTRPGVSAIASALLVELFVSILQHPDGAAAPAPITENPEQGDHPLGLVPHQIRGFLSTFSNIPITGRSYDCCSACSDRIVDTYRKDGWDFVQKAINDKDYVEELSGLKEVQRKAEENVADIEWDDDSEGLIED